MNGLDDVETWIAASLVEFYLRIWLGNGYDGDTKVMGLWKETKSGAPAQRREKRGAPVSAKAGQRHVSEQSDQSQALVPA